jgi:hypothetical protein
VTIHAATETWALPSLARKDIPTRPLGPPDVAAVTALLRGEGEWLLDCFGSVTALLSEGMADGVEENGRLVAIAATWVIAPPYAEVGAHTDPAARGKGYATAVAHATMKAVVAKQLVPQWTAYADDVSSLGIARRLGMAPVDRGVEYRKDE